MKQIFVAVLLCCSPFAEARCVDFFYVKRPVALSTIYHEYVAAEAGTERWVFGLTKGNEDLSAFTKFREQNVRVKLDVERLGSLCGPSAEDALALANETSEKWRHRYKAWIPFLARMAVTPVMGKPCRKSASDIRAKLVALF